MTEKLTQLKAMILRRAGILPVAGAPRTDRGGNSSAIASLMFNFQLNMCGAPPPELRHFLWIRSLDKAALGDFLKTASVAPSNSSDSVFGAQYDRSLTARHAVQEAFLALCIQEIEALPLQPSATQSDMRAQARE